MLDRSKAVAKRAGLDPAQFDLRKWAQTASLISEEVFQVTLIGSDGFQKATTANYNGPLIYFGDRPHFQQLLQTEDDQLVISVPVVGRTSGRMALQFLRRKGPFADAPRPGLILLDVNLPRRSGLEVLSLRVDPDSSLWIGTVKDGLLHLGASGLRHLRQPCLELGRVLLGVVRALAERRRLAGLGEVQQNEDGQPDDRREPRVRTDRADEVMDRERERKVRHFRAPVYVAVRALALPVGSVRARDRRDTCSASAAASLKLPATTSTRPPVTG